MLIVRTTEDPTDPICELISTEQPLGLNYLAFAMDPLPLYSIEPRALGRQKARHYPHPGFATTVFDPAVVGGDPAPLTSWLLCQLALSQITSKAFLPLSWSLWQHHSRNCVVLWN